MLFDHVCRVLGTNNMLPRLDATNYKTYIRDLDMALFGGYLLQRVSISILHSKEIDVAAKRLMRITGDVFIILLNISDGINTGGDVGGVACRSVPRCIEQLLQHEFMHVIVMRVNHELHMTINDNAGHSRLFRVWLQKIFGQHRADNSLLQKI